MSTYVAFLRAINVGGRNVTMAVLRQVFSDAGFADVRSILASGNIVFDAPPRSRPAALERRIERDLYEALGYEVATFLRRPGELVGIAGAGFPNEAGAYQVGFLKAEPDAPAREAVRDLAGSVDRVRVVGREVHWLRTEPAESKLENRDFERALGAEMTFRNVTTLRRVGTPTTPDEPVSTQGQPVRRSTIRL